MTTEEFITKAKAVHGDKYDYSKVEYVNTSTKVCIICPEHGEFWQVPTSHLKGFGCFNCSIGYSKSYKFNLLEEFISEVEFKSFLMNNDINILQAIIQNIMPGSKFEPLQKDIERALNGATNGVDPLRALEEKYKTEEDDDTSVDTNDDVEPFEIDLDDDTVDDEDDVVSETDTVAESQPEPTIADVINARERELNAIDKIEHSLTPEIKEYILYKFRNDKLREFMSNN